MKKQIRLTESDLHRIVKESVQKILKEAQRGKEVFTISAFDIESEEDVSDMQYCSPTYYSVDDAIDTARMFAKSLASDDRVIMVTVYAGEYENGNGDIFGEPQDIYTISNKDRRTTAIARKRCGYASEKVDEYAVGH